MQAKKILTLSLLAVSEFGGVGGRWLRTIGKVIRPICGCELLALLDRPPRVVIGCGGGCDQERVTIFARRILERAAIVANEQPALN